MRSNNSAILAAALAASLGGCGAWRDPPPAAAAVPATDGGLSPAESGYPANDVPGAAYPDQTPAYQPPAAPAPNGSRGPLPSTYRQPVADPAGPPPPAQAVRYDNVGYAVWSNEAGTVAAAHPSLPPGSFAEVTALDTGRTILVPITAAARPGHEIELSGAAAQQLGLTGGGSAPVRVRAANASGPDMVALRSGRAAEARPDTPPVLLNALRHKLGGSFGRTTPDFAPDSAAPPVGPSRAPLARPAPARPAGGSGYYVQIAALSDAGRAQALARSLGGGVAAGGGVYRVRLGPYPTPAAAQAARDGAARRGYGDARIVRED